MTTRITCIDEATADTLAAGIDEAGFDVAVIAEGSDAEPAFVVYTPAAPEQLVELLPPGAPVDTY